MKLFRTIFISVLLIFMCSSLSHASLIDNGDQTFTDTDTSTMWYYAGRLNWYQAEDYARDLTVGKYDDWRLPSYLELYNLRSSIALPRPTGNSTSTFLADGITFHAYDYWTTQRRPSTGDHAVMSFYQNPIGISHWTSSSFPNYVLCSRNLTIEPVPEPGTMTLLFIGLSCLAGVTRKKI